MTVKKKNTEFSEIQFIGELSRDGVFIYDTDESKLVYVNEALVNILEIKRKVLQEDPQLILRTIKEDELDFLQVRFRELLERKYVEDLQVRISLSQVMKTLSLNCYCLPERVCIIGFVKDISRSRERQDYLINYGAKKDALLDSVSQNLTTPLNLSRFTVDLIEKAVHEKKFHKINAHVSLIREVTAECIRSIEDLMREEHMESPTIHTQANRFELVGKIQVILDQLKASNPEKNFKLKSETNHLFFTGDDLKFFQIVHNLLSNAVKFTRPNGEIAVFVKIGKAVVTVIVQDNGIGIPAHLQPHLFQKDSRAARPGLKGEASNGIGLYVVKKLTELMGGQVSFESRVNKGTTFTISLPRK